MDRGFGWVGCISFNNKGEVVTKFSEVKDGDSPLVTEVIAAMDIALYCGLDKVSVFSDSKTAIDLINNSHNHHLSLEKLRFNAEN